MDPETRNLGLLVVSAGLLIAQQAQKSDVAVHAYICIHVWAFLYINQADLRFQTSCPELHMVMHPCRCGYLNFQNFWQLPQLHAVDLEAASSQQEHSDCCSSWLNFIYIALNECWRADLISWLIMIDHWSMASSPHACLNCNTMTACQPSGFICYWIQHATMKARPEAWPARPHSTFMSFKFDIGMIHNLRAQSSHW